MAKKRAVKRKVFIWLMAIFLFLVTAIALGLVMVNRYLNSEKFLTRVKAEVKNKAGLEVELGSLQVSLLKGLVMKEIFLASPVAGEPPVIEVSEIVFKYDLVALLQRKIHINEIVVNRPQVRLCKDSQGKWNLPRRKSKEGTEPKKARKIGREEEITAKKEPAWKVSIESFRVKHGVVELWTGTDYDPIEFRDLNLTARLLQLTGQKDIEAHLSLGAASLQGRAVVKGLEIPLTLKEETLQVDRLKASLAGGAVTATAKADLRSSASIPCQLRMNISNLDVPTLLKEMAGGKETGMEVSGKMFGEISARGDARDPDALRAEGGVEIRNGTLSGAPAQEVIAALTQDEYLENIHFDQMTVQFRFARRVLDLIDLIIHSYRVKITTRGTVDFAREREMDLTIGLNFHEKLVGDIKVRELRHILEPSKIDKEYRSFDFKVWGKPPDLKNDFTERLAKKGAGEWLKGELIKGYKKDKKKEEKGEHREKKPEEELIEEGVDAIFKLLGR